MRRVRLIVVVVIGVLSIMALAAVSVQLVSQSLTCIRAARPNKRFNAGTFRHTNAAHPAEARRHASSASGGHSPNRVADVVGDQQRSGLVDRKADRTPARLIAGI